MHRPPIDPLMLFRSFLTVVSGFVLSQFIYLVIGLALGYLFFPEFLAFFELDEAEQKKQIAENVQAFIPIPMFVMHLILSFIALYFVGWLSAAWSPFAHFQHGLFIAILVFVWFLQAMFDDPPSKKLMDLALMLTLPIGILLGARHASAALETANDEFDDEHSDLSDNESDE